MPSDFDPYYKWLGIPPEEQPPNHYRLLGVKQFEDNPDVIENACDQRMAFIRTFQTGPRSAESQKVLNELAAAKVCLLNPEKKRDYDEQLKASLVATPPVAPVQPSQPFSPQAAPPQPAPPLAEPSPAPELLPVGTGPAPDGPSPAIAVGKRAAIHHYPRRRRSKMFVPAALAASACVAVMTCVGIVIAISMWRDSEPIQPNHSAIAQSQSTNTATSKTQSNTNNSRNTSTTTKTPGNGTSSQANTTPGPQIRIRIRLSRRITRMIHSQQRMARRPTLAPTHSVRRPERMRSQRLRQTERRRTPLPTRANCKRRSPRFERSTKRNMKVR